MKQNVIIEKKNYNKEITVIVSVWFLEGHMYPFFLFVGGIRLTDCDWPFWLIIRVRNNHWNIVIAVKQVEIVTLMYEARNKKNKKNTWLISFKC